MADEPRRSGRSTKGQHSKIADDVQTPEPVAKPVKKGKPGKKSKPSVVEYDIQEGIRDADGEFIRCACGVLDESEDGRDMIACEKCDGWQHNDCIGYPKRSLELEGYHCWVCRPGDHPELVSILGKGREIWAEWVDQKQVAYEEGAPFPAVEKKGKGGRGKQAVRPEAPAVSTPATKSDTSKRKHSTESPANGSTAKSRVPSTQSLKTEDANTSKRRKTSTAPEQGSPAPERAPISITDLPNGPRKKVAEELKKTFTAAVQELLDAKSYQIPEGENIETVSERFALDVEHAMFVNFAGTPPQYTGEYKKKWSSINFNIGKNNKLMLRLLQIQVTPDELTKMSTDEMASDELQEQRAEMKRKADEQAILPTDTGPRMRRTHKGDEIIEEHTQFSNDGAITTAPIRRRDSEADGEEDPAASKEGIDGIPLSPSRERRPSSAFSSGWKPAQSPSTSNPPTFLPPAPQKPINPAVERKQNAEIDRLLNQDEDDAEEYTPAEVVLNVTIDMPVGETKNSIAKFTGSAKHVAGGEVSARIPMSQMFPDPGQSIEVGGRIKTQLADDYVSNLHAASDTDVVVWSLKTSDGPQFDGLFNYLASRERFGVGRSYRSYIRDLYIIPIEKGTDKLPSFLNLLSYCEIPVPTQDRLLLLTYILRWDPNSLPSSHTTTPAAATTAPRGISAMSPINAVTPHQQPSALPPGHYHQGQTTYPTHPSAQSPSMPTNSYPQGPQDIARDILGPLYSTPVFQQLLGLSGNKFEAGQLQNLKHIMEQYPDTRTDFAAFQARLTGSGGHGGNGTI